MLTEVGRVVAVEDQAVWVETLRQSTCGSCAARAGCGHGMLNTAAAGASRGLVKALLPNAKDLALSVHDTVEISLPETRFLRAAFLLYLLPLSTTVLAAMTANGLLADGGLTQPAIDLRVTLSAIAGLSFGLLLVRLLSSRRPRETYWHPTVTAKV
ncbi:MAG: SoxR reducing system RseC family protein [Pseudomonadota bacterium]